MLGSKQGMRDNREGPPGPVHLRPHRPPHPRTATFLSDRRVINVLPRPSFHSSARIDGLSSRSSARAMGVSHDLCTVQALSNVLTGSRELAEETNMKRRSELPIPTCPTAMMSGGTATAGLGLDMLAFWAGKRTSKEVTSTSRQ
ncbi:hypothetical protein BO79DRAFT_241526 [Aspergillus costaricaensis CBS 115574]|uniref:Uncharacterized protein n=1 Tax=Aspergillus costaricaensis CBS 115574 TaxID=1448317 RepID=A0ACD1HYD4_9EURO|nr:hypothetical protein BO79DRAFT_241526 [Aspergillus costaricaensis CBS 115574]RAK82968.1 hypothetical protein BO79DRAFT_241526 [Aspergillus costaricaensis CBS 115574]